MNGSIVPSVPSPPVPAPDPVECVVTRNPLAAIREVLAISIHDVVNDRRYKAVVYDLYRVTRRIEADSWFRHELARIAEEAWIASLL